MSIVDEISQGEQKPTPRVIGTRPIAAVNRRRPRSRYQNLFAVIRENTEQSKAATQIVCHGPADRRNMVASLRLLAARHGVRLITRSASLDLNPHELLCWTAQPKPRGDGSVP